MFSSPGCGCADTHPPRRDTTFAAGDEAYLVGLPDEVMQVLRQDAPGQPAVGIEIP